MEINEIEGNFTDTKKLGENVWKNKLWLSTEKRGITTLIEIDSKQKALNIIKELEEEGVFR